MCTPVHRPTPPTEAPASPLYRISLPEPGQEFYFEVHRAGSTGADGGGSAPGGGSAGDSGGGSSASHPALFSTKGWGLVFKEQYMQLSTWLGGSTSHVYGLGQRVTTGGLECERNGDVVTLWNHDYPGEGVLGWHASCSGLCLR